ncbi:bifunctional hydroxymethylpyrimidine kinase/phosphomethylpyrimidine kinase [Aurantiacibacter luteus]|uniref:hydroxymethylpyrimidine kinase n=1 Tax=Aurantiacibacter luteus TaxID=1581420 RepID=A0A0G9MTE4_9SPHN|nr:bifunctional hydroxymethylpyrimidine kinase/phosphomethylpyrimidine kinase [Aurantiacibacter luteus]KLE33981.1 phosphomethylpyrimidine kinase [Aurantiacibacter luteus]
MTADPNRPPRVLVIAGSDSSGGAGIQADIKTVTMLGGYAMTAITAVTAQNTRGVRAVETLSPDFVAAQIDGCLEDIGADAVKVGMLGSADIAEVVADRLEDLPCPIVFDPVMVATSGSVLADPATVEVFDWLMELAALTTPNVPELAALGGPEGMKARNDGGGVAYLAKGGDAEGPMVEDRLVRPGMEDVVWSEARIVTRHTHGTGCTLSSAIATHLGRGLRLEDAVALGRRFVREAMMQAPGFGLGNGPLGHQAVSQAGQN